MIVSTQPWPVAARIAIAFLNVGFAVAAISPRRSMIRKIGRVDAHFAYRPRSGTRSIAEAIGAWPPDFLVCQDDRAVDALRTLHLRACNSPTDANLIRLRDLIEISLGDPAGFAIAREKSKFILSAQSAGVRCPGTVVIPPEQDVEQFLPHVTYPIVVKADGAWGGRYVQFAEDEKKSRTVFREFQLADRWPMSVRQPIARLSVLSFLNAFFKQRRSISLQQYIVGRPANRAVACLNGKVLAGISVEAIETLYEFGPATVVRIVDHPEMDAAAETMAKQLELSGFFGFDFVLDNANAAWLIEMNARVTPICHIASAGRTSLAAALFKTLSGSQPTTKGRLVSESLIALFPQELQRSPRSEYVWKSYHDVPWEEPELVRACLDSALSGGLRKRLGRSIRNAQNSRSRMIRETNACPPANAEAAE